MERSRLDDGMRRRDANTAKGATGVELRQSDRAAIDEDMPSQGQVTKLLYLVDNGCLWDVADVLG